MPVDSLDIKIKALTPIWTGGVKGNCDQLHNTGIIGSLRWWYEAIVRGLGGYACDPTSDQKCQLTGEEKSEEEQKEKLCPVCYLFGCTGWQRKFRMEIREDRNGKFGPIKVSPVNLEKEKTGEEFWLRFISLKKIDPVEKGLICVTLSIISKYGAIGKKTFFDPSLKRPQQQHGKYGLFKVITDLSKYKVTRLLVDEYLESFNSHFLKNDSQWADVRYFLPSDQENGEQEHQNETNLREKESISGEVILNEYFC